MSPVISKKRLVKPPVVFVQDSPPANCSDAFHPSTVNLYSIESFDKGTVTS